MVDMSAFTELRRSTADRKISGLCGGIARERHIDPLLVRVLAILFALSGGLGVVVYVFGSLLVVADNATEPAIHRYIPQTRTWKREVWAVLLVVCCVVVASLLGSMIPIGLTPALVVLAVWYFGFRKSGGAASTGTAPTRSTFPPPAPPMGAAIDPPTGPATPFTDAARAWQARVTQHQQAHSTSAEPEPWHLASDPTDQRSSTDPSADPDPWRPEPATQPPPRAGAVASAQGFWSHPDPAGLYAASPLPAANSGLAVHARPGATVAARRLRLGVVIAVGLALAALGLADLLGTTIPVVGYLATALLVIGLGLVVAAWTGRARGLLGLGILVLIATAVFNVVGVANSSDQPWLTNDISYPSLTALPPSVHYDVGSFDLDLNDIAVTSARTFAVNLDTGTLRLDLPEGYRVRVEASVDTGSVILPDQRRAGSDASLVGAYGPQDASGPILTIQAHVGTGVLEVRR